MTSPTVTMTKKGIKISCVYNNKTRRGVVEQMKLVNNEILLTVKTEEGYRSMYFDKMENCTITA